jgi:hypothetical protein
MILQTCNESGMRTAKIGFDDEQTLAVHRIFLFSRSSTLANGTPS